MSEKQEIEACEPYIISKNVLDKVHLAMSEDVSKMTELFKLLSDPIRLHILKALEIQDLCVCILVEVTNYKHSALSYHLKLLKDADIVDSKRDKSFQTYFLTGYGRSLIASLEKILPPL
ncbi:MAG: metalloregulator ArsR/SmtB family transcription factor [Methanosarcinaceae archaeon]|nr:metalloregulator ArsR/SmtB family transcription factor [Methanosarcinaceae archaeon]MDF1533863.1 metalloregulator ArsR/SmtB family transcription factor [Methanosarcinaceae archaeon]